MLGNDGRDHSHVYEGVSRAALIKEDGWTAMFQNAGRPSKRPADTTALREIYAALGERGRTLGFLPGQGTSCCSGPHLSCEQPESQGGW